MTEQVRAAIPDLVVQRGRECSLRPSEVAKALAPDWRGLMPEVRAVAASRPWIGATQGRVEADPLTAPGPIRLRLR